MIRAAPSFLSGPPYSARLLYGTPPLRHASPRFLRTAVGPLSFKRPLGHQVKWILRREWVQCPSQKLHFVLFYSSLWNNTAWWQYLQCIGPVSGKNLCTFPVSKSNHGYTEQGIGESRHVLVLLGLAATWSRIGLAVKLDTFETG